MLSIVLKVVVESGFCRKKIREFSKCSRTPSLDQQLTERRAANFPDVRFLRAKLPP